MHGTLHARDVLFKANIYPTVTRVPLGLPRGSLILYVPLFTAVPVTNDAAALSLMQLHFARDYDESKLAAVVVIPLCIMPIRRLLPSFNLLSTLPFSTGFTIINNI